VIAEGIETQAQLAFLEARQCAEGQGHLFSETCVRGSMHQLLQIGTLEIRDEASQF